MTEPNLLDDDVLFDDILHDTPAGAAAARKTSSCFGEKQKRKVK